MARKLAKSLEVDRAWPSAMFAGTDTTARVIWATRRLLSLAGNFSARSYIRSTRSIALRQTSRSRCDRTFSDTALSTLNCALSTPLALLKQLLELLGHLRQRLLGHLGFTVRTLANDNVHLPEFRAGAGVVIAGLRSPALLAFQGSQRDRLRDGEERP